MGTVVVSSKFQVAIPKDLRESMGIKAGTRLEIISYANRIELVPVLPLKNLKGIFKGINTDIQRDEDRS